MSISNRPLHSTRRSRSWFVRFSCVASVLLASCGPELSPVSVVEGVRILGVRKSLPYAREGETVNLELLWDVGHGQSTSGVQRFFGFWCTNPSGDLFAECLNGPPSVPPRFVFNEDRFELTIPEGTVRSRPGGTAPYGLAVVFYGVCAGRLQIGSSVIAPDGLGGMAGGDATDRSDVPTSGMTDGRGNFSGLPVCVDDDGKAVDSRGFVVGYSQIFVYPEFRNSNPHLTGFRVNGSSVAADCVDSDCVGRPFDVTELDGCGPGVVCVPACEEDGAVTCPGVPLSIVVDQDSVEPDEVARETFGETLDETMWVSYFVDRGRLSADIRLVNDATSGWNENQRTQFLAPSEPGPFRIWAVVRDSRGGVAWARVAGFVTPPEQQ